jgi:recombination associated protein RdgC
VSFKNVLVYSLTQSLDLLQFVDKLNEREFKPCLPTDSVSVGWAKSAEFLVENNLVYRIGQYDLIALKTETKVLPAASINKLLIDKITDIESREHRRVKGRERADLKDQIIHELLPRALSKESVTMAYVDRVKHQIIVNASSASAAEKLLSHLRKTIGSLPVVPLAVENNLSGTITGWVSDHFPEEFKPGNSASISTDEDGVIKLKNIDLLSQDARSHIDAGGRVTKIALNWAEIVAFDLDSNLGIKRIRLLDLFNENRDEEYDSAAALFEADLTLFAGGMAELIEKLVAVFGGLAKRKAA